MRSGKGRLLPRGPTADSVEVETGTPLHKVVALAGGVTGKTAPQALLVGGYFGAWVGARDALRLGLSNTSLKDVGASVGCGIVATKRCSASSRTTRTSRTTCTTYSSA